MTAGTCGCIGACKCSLCLSLTDTCRKPHKARRVCHRAHATFSLCQSAPQGHRSAHLAGSRDPLLTLPNQLQQPGHVLLLLLLHMRVGAEKQSAYAQPGTMVTSAPAGSKCAVLSCAHPRHAHQGRQLTGIEV